MAKNTIQYHLIQCNTLLSNAASIQKHVGEYKGTWHIYSLQHACNYPSFLEAAASQTEVRKIAVKFPRQKWNSHDVVVLNTWLILLILVAYSDACKAETDTAQWPPFLHTFFVSRSASQGDFGRIQNVVSRYSSALTFVQTVRVSGSVDNDLWHWLLKLPFLRSSWKWKKIGPSNISFPSFRAVFHFHDYGRKGRVWLTLEWGYDFRMIDPSCKRLRN